MILIRDTLTGEVQAVAGLDGYPAPRFVPLGTAPEDAAHVAITSDGAVDLAPAWAALRIERDRRLSATDWTQLADVPDGARWRPYRQALRDLPALTADPLNPEWPEIPGSDEGENP
jgi:hypothetical protein